MNYENVREAVVVVRPSGELVAYIVVRDGKDWCKTRCADTLTTSCLCT